MRYRLMPHVLVRVVALLCELVQRFGFFKRGEILALEVLDQRQLHHLDIIHFADDHGNLPKADLDGGVVPALASNDLEPAGALPHDEWLDDAFLGHRGHQLRQISHAPGRCTC